MAFRDLTDIIGPIALPIRGKTYTLPEISLEDGLRMHSAAANNSALPLSDLIRIILGDIQQEMLDDHVPLGVIDRALWTGVADFQSGREAAEAVWEHGVPKAVLETLLRPLTEALTTQPAEASTTKPPASGNGTTSPKKPAPRSRGSKS
jgi:hypothetical protein